ncbi:hypothetical protein RchiOBHm_Chr2g0112991 [Rosa chinensis]|uniref:Uncharacterized protein n=1 Tax=Rosa chinensis TaxID=74649 RepID=A0A2P6RQC8_ROSCH|nr:hypothetical protein RchiOBHm_Chr2g0112991 [Rosa chinensis]
MGHPAVGFPSFGVNLRSIGDRDFQVSFRFVIILSNCRLRKFNCVQGNVASYG